LPLKSFKCSVCGASSPKKYLAEGQFEKRMAWLRRHRKRKHPRLHKKATAKMLRTKKSRGLIKKGGNLMARKRRKSTKGKKWGKIGAPKSAKRKTFLAKVRKKRKRK